MQCRLWGRGGRIWLAADFSDAHTPAHSSSKTHLAEIACLLKLCVHNLPGGVTVARGILNPLVGVRIPAGQFFVSIAGERGGVSPLVLTFATGDAVRFLVR